MSYHCPLEDESGGSEYSETYIKRTHGTFVGVRLMDVSAYYRFENTCTGLEKSLGFRGCPLNASCPLNCLP